MLLGNLLQQLLLRKQHCVGTLIPVGDVLLEVKDVLPARVVCSNTHDIDFWGGESLEVLTEIAGWQSPESSNESTGSTVSHPTTSQG